MTGSPFNWKLHAGRALEAALNRALALDPDTRDGLLALDGRAIALQLAAPSTEASPLALQVRIESGRFVVGPVDADNAPDLSIRSSLGALVSQLPSLLGNVLRQDVAPPVGRLHISGDAELARRMQRLAERFDPDWQQPFAAVFGDIMGVQIANAVAATLRQARTFGQSLVYSAAEYVTEESRDVIPRAELEAFHEGVDALRDDTARLSARIVRMTDAVPATDAHVGDGPAGDAHADEGQTGKRSTHARSRM